MLIRPLLDSKDLSGKAIRGGTIRPGLPIRQPAVAAEGDPAQLSPLRTFAPIYRLTTPALALSPGASRYKVTTRYLRRRRRTRRSSSISSKHPKHELYTTGRRTPRSFRSNLVDTRLARLGSRFILGRQRVCAYRYRSILCSQGHQQEADGREGTYGEYRLSLLEKTGHPPSAPAKPDAHL